MECVLCEVLGCVLQLRQKPVLAHALGTCEANLLVKLHGIDLPTLPAAARREKWQDFTPPAARLSRRYRGLILHGRFQLCHGSLLQFAIDAA